LSSCARFVMRSRWSPRLPSHEHYYSAWILVSPDHSQCVGLAALIYHKGCRSLRRHSSTCDHPFLWIALNLTSEQTETVEQAKQAVKNARMPQVCHALIMQFCNDTLIAMSAHRKVA